MGDLTTVSAETMMYPKLEKHLQHQLITPL